MTDTTSTHENPWEPAEAKLTTAKTTRRTAFFSVHDDFKPAALEFARELHELGNWDLVSSGRTAKYFTDNGLPVTSVPEITDWPEILDHRVVTLHPKIFGAILAERDNPAHDADREEYGISLFDLVVVAMYPFGSKPSIDMIDIGGSALVRAAAKNSEFVGVVVDPQDYDVVLAELRELGMLSPWTRKWLAYKAFDTTASYDAEIRDWLRKENPELFGEVKVRAPYCMQDGIRMLRAGSMYGCPACGAVAPGLAVEG